MKVGNVVTTNDLRKSPMYVIIKGPYKMSGERDKWMAVDIMRCKDEVLFYGVKANILEVISDTQTWAEGYQVGKVLDHI